MFSKVGIGLLVASVLFGAPAKAAGRFGQRAQASTPAPAATFNRAPPPPSGTVAPPPSNGNRGSYHSSSSVPQSSHYHSASSVPSGSGGRSYSHGYGSHSRGHSSVTVVVPPVRTHVYSRPYYQPRYYAGASVYAAPRVYENTVPAAPSYAPQYQEQPTAVTTVEESAPGRVMVGLEGHLFSQGANLGATASVEDSRWGFTAQGYHWALGALDDSGGIDTMQTASARLTYAFLSGPNGRLRVEAGADLARTQNLLMVGPTLGASGLLKVSFVSFEASANWTPVPFQQLDLRAGVSFGIVTVRGGWRTQLLTERGIDGLEGAEVFSGPYAGLALVF